MVEYYTPEEIAAKLKLHINTVWRYLKSGKLKASRIGNRYRVSDQQLEQFLSETVTLGVPMAVKEESAGALKYDTSHRATSDKPRVSAYGKHPLKGRTLEDIMREKHEESEANLHSVESPFSLSSSSSVVSTTGSGQRSPFSQQSTHTT